MVQCFGSHAEKGAEEDPCITAGGLAERPAGCRLADPHSESPRFRGCWKAVQTAGWGHLGFLPRPQGRAPSPQTWEISPCLLPCGIVRPHSLVVAWTGRRLPLPHPPSVAACPRPSLSIGKNAAPGLAPSPQPPSEPFGRPTALRSRSRMTAARHVLIVTRFGPPLPPGNTQKTCGMYSLPQAAALMDRSGVYRGLCPSTTSKMSALGSSSSHRTPLSQSQGSRRRRLCHRRSPSLTYIPPNSNTSTRLALLTSPPVQHRAPTAHHAALHFRRP